MKNLHLISTDKPSRLVLDSINNNLFLTTTKSFPSDIMKFKNIYITSDEEIKEGFYGLIGKEVGKIILTEEGYEFLIGKGVSYEYGDFHSLQKICKKIILTTDQDLIKDGVQSIDDDFLQWFVKNPSCDEVEVKPLLSNNGRALFGYKIIIPKEEPNKTSYLDELPNMDKDVLLKMWESAIPKLKLKQETIEEAAANLSDPSLCKTDNWIAGAKWAQERMYSEEDIQKAFKAGFSNGFASDILSTEKLQKEKERLFCEWFEQFKKK